MNKYSKNLILKIAVYGMTLFKLIMTIVTFFLQGEFMSISIISLYILLGLSLDNEMTIFCLIGIVIVMLIWLLILILSLAGMRSKRAQYISIVFILISTAVDFLLAIVFSVIEIKIICSVLSIFLIALCIKNLEKLKS